MRLTPLPFISFLTPLLLYRPPPSPFSLTCIGRRCAEPDPGCARDLFSLSLSFGALPMLPPSKPATWPAPFVSRASGAGLRSCVP